MACLKILIFEHVQKKQWICEYIPSWPNPPKKYPHQGCSNSKCWYCARRTLEIWFKAHHRMLGLGWPLLEAIPYPHWGMHSTGRNIYVSTFDWQSTRRTVATGSRSPLFRGWAMALGKNIQIATDYIILCEIQGRVFIHLLFVTCASHNGFVQCTPKSSKIHRLIVIALVRHRKLSFFGGCSTL